MFCSWTMTTDSEGKIRPRNNTDSDNHGITRMNTDFIWPRKNAHEHDSNWPWKHIHPKTKELSFLQFLCLEFPSVFFRVFPWHFISVFVRGTIRSMPFDFSRRRF